MKVLKLFFFLIVFLALSVRPILAIVDPLSVANNRFGIHVLEVDDLKPAANLVNSQGGDWGYVTLIIRQNDRDQEKWQAIFDSLRRLHLIPIVRLATESENDYWVSPKSEDVSSWVEFLNSLNWVVKNRYVVLFNEPNHAKEWGNNLNPQAYTSIVRQFHQQLKTTSSDFFILPVSTTSLNAYSLGMTRTAPQNPVPCSVVFM